MPSPRRRRRRDPEPGPDYDPEELERFQALQWRREAEHQEAARILDERLDLARDAALWYLATFATLTAAALAAVPILALTASAWWTLLPSALATACGWTTLTFARTLRETRRPPNRRRGER